MDIIKDNPMKTNAEFAVVTGASSGIGYELAKQFAKEGFDLLICAEDPGIVEVAQSISQHGTRVHTLIADLATDEGVNKLYSRIKEEPRPLSAIAINAGVGVGGASFDKTDWEKERNLIMLNVLGTVHLTKLIVKDMIHFGRGRILFTSSVAAFMPGPYETVYSASKAFLQSFAEGLRMEVKEKGVSITALQPGPTETNFFHRAGMDDTQVGISKKDDPKEVARVGFEAMMNNEENVIYGMKNKIQTNIAKIMPQAVAAKMHEGMTKPISPSDR